MIQKELNTGSAAIHKIIHKELHLKKTVCFWDAHNQTEHQKEEHIRKRKKIFKLLYDIVHHIISKIVTGDETYMSFLTSRRVKKVN